MTDNGMIANFMAGVALADRERAERDAWREKYASYLRACGPMDADEARALAVDAYEVSSNEDPEETASSDLACMREDSE